MRFAPDRHSCAGRLRVCCRCGGEFVLERGTDLQRKCPDCRPELAGAELEDVADRMQADPELRLRGATW